MTTGYLQKLGVMLLLLLPEHVVQADVAPPGVFVMIFGIYAVGLGLLVTAIVIVAVVLLRWIKKKYAADHDTVWDSR